MREVSSLFTLTKSSVSSLGGSKATSHGASKLGTKVKRLVFGVLEFGTEGALTGLVVDGKDTSN